MRELYISDTHFGFSNMEYLHRVYLFNKVFKADRVYQLGDFVDFYNFSRFLRSPNAPSLTDELKKTKRQVHQFAKWFPQVTILTGNHEKRIYKRAAEAGIPKFWLRGILDVLDAPKGLVYHPYDFLDNAGVVKAHGHLSSENAKRTHMNFYLKNTVHGHIHNQLGIEWNPRTNRKIWGMSTSCIVDKHSIAMAYSEQDFKNIICGFGYRDNNKPFVECLG